jgi:hypothetical protein
MAPPASQEVVLERAIELSHVVESKHQRAEQLRLGILDTQRKNAALQQDVSDLVRATVSSVFVRSVVAVVCLGM